MELIVNRIKYKLPNEEGLRIIVSANKDLMFHFNLSYFKKRFLIGEEKKIDEWALENEIDEDSYIGFSFSRNAAEEYLELPFIKEFEYYYTLWLLANYFKSTGFLIQIKPKGIDLSCFEFINEHNDFWDVYKKWDFKINTKYKELTFNIGSSESYISKDKIDLNEDLGNISCILSNKEIQKSKHIGLQKSKVVANRKLKTQQGLESSKAPINYAFRYKELKSFFNSKLKPSNKIMFHSIGFDSLRADKVSFSKNKMLFRNGQTDINPITGMRNYGVYQDVPNALEKQFIFIYQNNDDANTLYKYLKNGYKGFPGLLPYVNIPVTLANSIEKDKYKRLEYSNINTLMDEYKNFEEIELSEDYYPNLFAIVIGPFNKDEPCREYFNLKLSLIKKGIPSQFLNYENIRKSGVFNYHLPNIAIGIHAKMGGIPWRLDSPKKQELVIGFNQIVSEEGRFIGSTVFFDNQGRLKRTHAFEEQNSSNEVIGLLKIAIEDYLVQETDIQRLIIHYHKSLSQKDKSNIERVLRSEFNLSIPYAVVEVNDTKSRIELGFDPDHDFRMPVSGSFVRLTPKEYLLFNNNRFKEVAPIGVRDELPLKLKIHFADEAGFSHRELIEQVYEFSRLTWKGLKQRSQPATCFYAKEIARFKSFVDEPIPDNEITQTTPWVI
ncbi:hypothetical protein GO009_06745 [Muricauda sp. TY007]|uniref:Piwi domain-containing protein n=1 Tax=Allomuricauda sp. TY007 TaxID=2683200 RepID=UPI0013C0A860|nr:Piwi domain-containing protein [Muricauda sp. TY007]NDV15720.1 hypothetical protein [Muricauda sp. TY007]